MRGDVSRSLGDDGRAVADWERARTLFTEVRSGRAEEARARLALSDDGGDLQ